MDLPFSRAQFLEVFAHYNRGVWPAQLVLFAVGVACAIMLLELREGHENRRASRGIGVLVGLVWAWTAIAYHLMYFTPINGAAWLFAGACLVAANAFTAAAVSGALRFERPAGLSAVAGTLFLINGTIGYPFVTSLTGLQLAETPTFGLPCPTTIFTLGLLLFARRPIPTSVVVVPFAWCVVGTVAAFSLGMYADLALPIAGLVAAVLLRRPRLTRALTAGGHA